MRYTVLMLFAICFVACAHESRPIHILNGKNFVVIDTCSAANEYLRYDENINISPIYFIGYPKDTFNVGHEYLYNRQEWKDSINPLLHTYWSRTYSNKTLEIFVDTTLKTNLQDEYFLSDGTVSEDSIKNFHAFIFTVRNVSDSIVYLGHTFLMYYLHAEVKDENGEWVKIDRAYDEAVFCLTGQPMVALKPGQIIISKFRRHTGTFYTDFRLVFGYEDNQVYSNEFSDFVDKRTIANALAENKLNSRH